MVTLNRYLTNSLPNNAFLKIEMNFWLINGWNVNVNVNLSILICISIQNQPIIHEPIKFYKISTFYFSVTKSRIIFKSKNILSYTKNNFKIFWNLYDWILIRLLLFKKKNFDNKICFEVNCVNNFEVISNILFIPKI